MNCWERKKKWFLIFHLDLLNTGPQLWLCKQHRLTLFIQAPDTSQSKCRMTLIIQASPSLCDPVKLCLFFISLSLSKSGCSAPGAERLRECETDRVTVGQHTHTHKSVQRSLWLTDNLVCHTCLMATGEKAGDVSVHCSSRQSNCSFLCITMI